MTELAALVPNLWPPGRGGASRCGALELGGRGIPVVGIAPGVVESLPPAEDTRAFLQYELSPDARKLT